jgi:hypothetical protein
MCTSTIFQIFQYILFSLWVINILIGVINIFVGLSTFSIYILCKSSWKKVFHTAISSGTIVLQRRAKRLNRITEAFISFRTDETILVESGVFSDIPS